jgi:polysaccharide chain length determinant protein (PEP-CTERM system associated)
MTTTGNTGGRPRFAQEGKGQIAPEHYLRLIIHRKWLVLGTFLLVSAATFIISSRLPNVYMSSTLILVDPQKVPESYVKATVTGDLRNRLGTLQQQILSATRLQKIIDSLNLYPVERKTMAREDVIAMMQKDVSVSIVSNYGGSQDLEAFRIGFSGGNARQVAQVANDLATQFMDENLKAREQQSTGTSEFLQNQLQETKKVLEAQEGKLKDFKLKHLGEMPEQQTANLQILGQLQSQVQLVGESLARAEQQRSTIQALMPQASPVVDLDDREPQFSKPAAVVKAPPKESALVTLKARLSTLQQRYGDQHPDIRKVKEQIADEEAKEAAGKATPVEVPAAAPIEPKPDAPPAKRAPVPPPSYSNPVLQSQLTAIEGEIQKHQAEQRRLNKQIGVYQAKLEAIPVREQEVTGLVRDYEISKAHYSQLLDKGLSAETATQLEIRQKGEKFSILDPAQAAERPSSPNRILINMAGSFGGLALGLLLALVTDFLGVSITSPQQITEAFGLPVLEVIPVIQTYADRRTRKKRLVWASVTCLVATLVASCAILVYRSRM